MVKKWITIFVLLISHANIYAQCFVQVSLDRSSVYIQQPFKITITVLTATWYTAPLDFENLQIPNAFILPFDRTIPGMFTISNKQYAGLQFYFIVFPYHAGSFTVPSISITAQTPPAGSGESKKVVLHTEAMHFVVKPVPENMKGENWFVAKNVLISEKWNKPLSNLKVGDIIERTVTIDAKGTLPQFIPQLSKDSLDFASTYLQDATLLDERNDYDANGKLTQSIIYLLEKEGDHVIPAIPVEWWNPNSSKRYSRNAIAQNIHVRANPDLGMMATLKDSLQAKQAAIVSPTTSKKIQTIFGIAWYWFLAIALAILILLYELTRFIIHLVNHYKIKREQYLMSEQYAFRKFMHSSFDLHVLLNNLYNWWDKMIFPGKSAALSWQMRQLHFGNIQNELGSYFKSLYGPEPANAKAGSDFKNEIKEYREELKKISHDQENKISMYQETGLGGRP